MNDKPEDSELLKFLVENKADINAKSRKGDTPLNAVCKQKEESLEIIKFLVENKADINASRDGKTLLHLTCDKSRPDLDIIKYLIENQADINKGNKNGETPLLKVCENIDHKGYFYAGGEKKTPETIPDVIEFLLENKADVNQENNRKKNALTFTILSDPLTGATKQSREKVLDLLIKNGAKIGETQASIYGERFLGRILETKKLNPTDINIIKDLVELKCNLNVQNNEKSTLLHLLCSIPNPDSEISELIKTLVENKADVNLKNSDNHTPAQVHVGLNQSCNMEIINILVKASPSENNEEIDSRENSGDVSEDTSSN